MSITPPTRTINFIGMCPMKMQEIDGQQTGIATLGAVIVNGQVVVLQMSGHGRYFAYDASNQQINIDQSTALRYHRHFLLGLETQSALAKMLGVTVGAVNQWERGRRDIPLWVPRFLMWVQRAMDLMAEVDALRKLHNEIKEDRRE